MDLEDFTLTRIHDQEKIIYRLRKLITDLEDDLKHVTALSKDEAAELIANQSRELADLREQVRTEARRAGAAETHIFALQIELAREEEQAAVTIGMRDETIAGLRTRPAECLGVL